MEPGLDDTDTKARQIQLEIQRNMPPGEKLRRVLEANELMMRLIEAEERRLHPAAPRREIFLRGAAHRLGWDLVKKAYGWAPPDAG